MSDAPRGRAVALLLPVALAVVVHARSIGHSFMSDDAKLILGNPQITAGAPLSVLLGTDWFDTGHSGGIGYYRPVVKLSLRATYAFFGAQPLAYHAGNVLIHAAAVLALALLLGALVRPPAAALGACLFAVHPSTVQAVDIVTARSDLLAGAFFLATCALAARLPAGAAPSPARRTLIAAMALLAFASKESALLLPLPLAAIAVERGAKTRAVGALLAPVLAVEALFLAVRTRFVDVVPVPNALASLDLAGRARAVLAAVAFYAGRLVTGLPIARLPEMPRHVTPAVALGAAFLVAGAAVVLLGRGRTPAAFGVILLVSSLAPALAIWLIHIPRWKDELPVADRWLYLPAAGAAILMATALERLPVRAAVVAGGGVVLAFAATSVERAAMYQSQEAMADYVSSEYLSADPASLNPRERYFAAKMRAQRALMAGRVEEGLEALLEADRIAPALPDHLPVIAQAEMELGHPDRAAQALERLLSPGFAIAPAYEQQRADFGNDTLSRFDRADAWHLLGRAYDRLGRSADADAAFANAAREARGREDEAAYLVDLALQLERSGRTGEAGAALDRAAALRPAWDRPRKERARLDGSAR